LGVDCWAIPPIDADNRACYNEDIHERRTAMKCKECGEREAGELGLCPECEENLACVEEEDFQVGQEDDGEAD
jgi:hypothetical protein